MVRVSDSWELRIFCVWLTIIFFLWTCDDRRRCAFLTRRDRKRHNCNVSSSSAHLIKLRQLFREFFRRLTQTNRQWPWRLKQTAQMQFCMRFSAIFAVFYFSMSVSRHDVTFLINKRSIVENEARQNGKIFTRAISWRDSKKLPLQLRQISVTNFETSEQQRDNAKLVVGLAQRTRHPHLAQSRVRSESFNRKLIHIFILYELKECSSQVSRVWKT